MVVLAWVQIFSSFFTVNAPKETAWGWIGWLINKGFLWLSAQAPLLTATATVIMAGVALCGLRKWRVETTGKRKIELAEDILASVYEARDVIRWARVPAGYANEGASRPRSAEEEDDDDDQIKDAFYRTIERLKKGNEVFATIEAKKYRAMACFGKHAEQPFKDLQILRAEITYAAARLIENYPPSNSNVENQSKNGKRL
jgi:hypothetical protein